MTLLRLGTRRSLLAMAQSQMVADAIQAAHPHVHVELVPIVTSGDRYFGPLHTAGGKGMFTAELETALREGRIELAVHSAKDLPAQMAADLAIAAVPSREDARDALVTPGGGLAEAIEPGGLVGTSSLRRAAQLKALRGDLEITPLRGNVETRLKKVLEERQVHATVLAMAGLIRSGLLEKYSPHVRPLEVEQMVPAAGQGALAIQAAAGRQEVLGLLAALDHGPSREALLAERSIVQALGADCHSSLAVHVRAGRPSQWQGLTVASRVDGTDLRRYESQGPTAMEAADALLEQLRRDGAEQLLRKTE